MIRRCTNCGNGFEPIPADRRVCEKCRPSDGAIPQRVKADNEIGVVHRFCEICGTNIDDKFKTAKICGSPECKQAKAAEYQTKYATDRKV